MDFGNLLGGSTPKRSTAEPKKKHFRKCDPELVREAWPCFWDKEFVERSDSYQKMQWDCLRTVMAKKPKLKDHINKISAAFLYIFACWSAANPGVPLYPLIRGSEPADKRLLHELRTAPRLRKKSCKFLWKAKTATPESLREYAGYGEEVWKLELQEAERRAKDRIAAWRQSQKAAEQHE